MSNRVFIVSLVCLIVSDLAVFILFGLDKRKAETGRWRISESALLKAALVGPLGAWIAMRVFRHKTRKAKFRLLTPLFLLLRIAILAVWKLS